MATAAAAAHSGGGLAPDPGRRPRGAVLPLRAAASTRSPPLLLCSFPFLLASVLGSGRSGGVGLLAAGSRWLGTARFRGEGEHSGGRGGNMGLGGVGQGDDSDARARPGTLGLRRWLGTTAGWLGHARSGRGLRRRGRSRLGRPGGLVCVRRVCAAHRGVTTARVRVVACAREARHVFAAATSCRGHSHGATATRQDQGMAWPFSRRGCARMHPVGCGRGEVVSAARACAGCSRRGEGLKARPSRPAQCVGVCERVPAPGTTVAKPRHGRTTAQGRGNWA